MYKKTILVFAIILAVSASIAFLIAQHEKTFPRQLETIESTNHVRTLKEVTIKRITDDLDYGLSMVNIGDSVTVLVYNGPSKASMVILNKKKHKAVEEQIPLSEDLYAEKHFDCYIDNIEDDGTGKKMYITECGIAFYSDSKYKKGQVLKNFTSPKHK